MALLWRHSGGVVAGSGPGSPGCPSAVLRPLKKRTAYRHRDVPAPPQRAHLSIGCSCRPTLFIVQKGDS